MVKFRLKQFGFRFVKVTRFFAGGEAGRFARMIQYRNYDRCFKIILLFS